MVFLNYLKNSDCISIETQSMAFSGDIDDICSKTKLFNLWMVGDATSDFVFERLFKLNYFETVEHTNSNFSIFYVYTKSRLIKGLMTS